MMTSIYQKSRDSQVVGATPEPAPILWARALQQRFLDTERLLLAIGVHGAEAIWWPEHRKILKWLERHYPHGHQQVLDAAQEARKRPATVLHPRDCACWNCVLDLNAEVTEHIAKMYVRLMDGCSGQGE